MFCDLWLGESTLLQFTQATILDTIFQWEQILQSQSLLNFFHSFTFFETYYKMRILFFTYYMPSAYISGITFQTLFLHQNFCHVVLSKYMQTFTDCMLPYGIVSLKISISPHQLKLTILSYYLLSYVDCQEKYSITFLSMPSALHILTHLILLTTLGIIISIFQMKKVHQSALPKVTEPVRTESRSEPSLSILLD